MVNKESQKKSAKRYFVKKEDGIFIVNDSFFDQIESRFVALGLALHTWYQLHDQLLDDAIVGENTFIGNMKVVTGLERALTELEQRYPFLMQEVRGVARRHQGKPIYTC